MESCVVEWKSGACTGIHPSSLLSDLGVDATMARLDRFKHLLMFDREEDFRKTLQLDRSWWACRGVLMTYWLEKLILKPMREVWISCFGIPLHARCLNTYMSIGRQWGEVLSVEFGSVGSGVLDDDRIKLMTDLVAPLVVQFKLLVDDVEFECWIVEDGSSSFWLMQASPGHSGPGFSLDEHRVPGTSPEAAMANPEVLHRALGLLAADDSDKADGLPVSSYEASAIETPCSSPGYDLVQCSMENGIEDDGVDKVALRHDLDVSNMERPGTECCDQEGYGPCGGGPTDLEEVGPLAFCEPGIDVCREGVGFERIGFLCGC
ncbi:hypothetical protein Dimus_031867 [Dionaea muscipula]